MQINFCLNISKPILFSTKYTCTHTIQEATDRKSNVICITLIKIPDECVLGCPDQ